MGLHKRAITSTLHLRPLKLEWKSPPRVAGAKIKILKPPLPTGEFQDKHVQYHWMAFIGAGDNHTIQAYSTLRGLCTTYKNIFYIVTQGNWLIRFY